MRRVCYVSGTRADFGLMAHALKAAARDPRLQLSVCVTGMHLSPLYGETVAEIEAAGLRICARVPVPSDESTRAEMGRSIGHALLGIVDALERERPDVVMILGDRGEMLAGALAAVHLNIPVLHIHGGERSGTVDEPMRHAISKLSHVHCVTTARARERLIRMGERAEHVFVTGAPGLDGLADLASLPRDALCAKFGLKSDEPVALVVFHPVVQEAEAAGEQMAEVMRAVLDAGLQALCFMPNSDAGGARIRQVLASHAHAARMRVLKHLERAEFVSWMAAAQVMVGNSSGGIIEAASLGLPVVNIGSRQDGRERSGNVTDVPVQAAEIERALRRALAGGKRRYANVYGDGRATERIVELLATFPFDPSILNKANAY